MTDINTNPYLKYAATHPMERELWWSTATNHLKLACVADARLTASSPIEEHERVQELGHQAGRMALWAGKGCEDLWVWAARHIRDQVQYGILFRGIPDAAWNGVVDGYYDQVEFESEVREIPSILVMLI